jgi:predicted kinase
MMGHRLPGAGGYVGGLARPWLVMVTGEPGSGKTTLGRALSDALRVPFVSRDHVRGGMLATQGLWTGRLDGAAPREAAVEAFVEVLEAAAHAGVTVVVEFVVTPARLDALRRIEAAFRCVVVHTSCEDARSRADRRDRTDPFLARPDVLAALGHDSIDSFVAGPERDLVRQQLQTDLDLPTLPVRTDDGYAPLLAEIVDWVIAQARTSSR